MPGCRCLECSRGDQKCKRLSRWRLLTSTTNLQFKVGIISQFFFNQSLIFSTFLWKLSCEKNSIFALRAKTQSHFCPKTQGRGSFYLIKICEKLKKWPKNSDFPSKLNIGAAFGCSSLTQLSRSPVGVLRGPQVFSPLYLDIDMDLESCCTLKWVR